MKKTYLVLSLLFTSCVEESSYLKEFEEDIKLFESYNEFYLEEYYEMYMNTENLIYSLNLVNYPLFFEEKTNRYIYEDIYLINKQHMIPNNLELNLVEVKDIPYIKRTNEIMLLEKEAFKNYQEMVKDAKGLGIELVLYSGYRSIEKQASLWDSPYDFNNMYKAVPGYSEHHTGLALDISTYDVGITTASSKAFEYLKDNAYKFGFILRYPEGKEHITGYNYEPWHYRYVGKIAKHIYEDDLTLEEYIYENILIY